MLLSEVKPGEKVKINKIKGREAFRKRFMEMGFVVGKEITIIKKAPLHGPIEYEILGYRGLIRYHQAEFIEVSYFDENSDIKESSYQTIKEDSAKIFSTYTKYNKNISVLLIGNPNSGKTTLFNLLTNQKERVGNYSGVTIENKENTFDYKGYSIHLTDTPGIFSLSAYLDETKNFIHKFFNVLPDLVINVIDANNLERNLYLTTDLIDSDVKSILALNMYDEYTEKGNQLDYDSLSKMIGRPIIPIVSTKNQGIENLLDTIIETHEDKNPIIRHTHIYYSNAIEEGIKRIQDKILNSENADLTDHYSTRYLAIKLLEKDLFAQESIKTETKNADEILSTAAKEIIKLEKNFNTLSENLISEAKYGFINGALKENQKTNTAQKVKTSEIIDSFLTHKLFGFPLFAFFMWLTFFTTFKIGEYPMNWIDHGVALISKLISANMSNGILKDLLIDGIIGGVGGVIVFLPNILILFFFISLMEDTGYMSRAVFIMDKLMHKIGLHGKSFIPLVMGFGCNVPAIMASRILENKNERIITILINPFISCNARLPIYILMIAAFFPNAPTLALFSVYAFGIIIAVITALLLKKIIFKSEEAPFVMELPPYRIPSIKIITQHMWERGSQYLQKIGGVILIASTIFWAMSYFPRDEKIINKYNNQISEINLKYKNNIENAASVLSSQSAIKQRNSIISKIELQKNGDLKQNSYIGIIGRTMDPVLAPLGFDWKIGISLLSGIPAKEIIVSTMGVLYQIDGPDSEHSYSLSKKLKNQTFSSGKKIGQKIFNPWMAYGLMIFVLLYFPCIGTITAIIKETGSWKWGAFSIIYSLGLAWLFAFAINQMGYIL
ncbi:MAG: ferrous iron transport protein B [Bacteroidota bacterium]